MFRSWSLKRPQDRGIFRDDNQLLGNNRLLAAPAAIGPLLQGLFVTRVES